MQEMISQKVRTLSPEIDPLRMGMGQTEADLEKPQVMVESTFGDSHPGSAHLLCLVEAAAAGVRSAGGNPARYFATDICDGMAQGHDGINYSLASREIIADAIEIHGMATPFDATVYIASCDKGLPANLMASGRLNTPGIFVPGGVMDAGPDLLTLSRSVHTAPNMSAARSPRSSSGFIRPMPARPAEHAALWARRAR